jgi:hypothetical protein
MYSNMRQLAGIAQLATPTALQYRRHTGKIKPKKSHRLPINTAFSLCSQPELPVALRFILPLGGSVHLTLRCLTRADQTLRVRRPEQSPPNPTTSWEGIIESKRQINVKKQKQNKAKQSGPISKTHVQP